VIPVVLLAAGAGLLTAFAEAADARLLATPPEALLWGALGVLFARVFRAGPLVVAVPLLVAGIDVALGGADGPAPGGDPLTLALPWGSRVLATEAAFAAAAWWWAGRVPDLRTRATRAALLVALAAAVVTGRAVPGLTALGLAFLAVNADRLPALAARG
jgi:hypothetical protein